MDVPVKRVMMESPLCIGPDLSGALARLLMLESGVGALPVVDEVGRPIGMLSKTDMVRDAPLTRARGRGWSDPALRRAGLMDDVDSEEATLQALDFYVEDINEPKVRDLMTPLVLSVSADVPVLVAARLMIENDVHHLPVVGKRGELVGIVSPFDFVRAVARLDASAEGSEDEVKLPDHSALPRSSGA